MAYGAGIRAALRLLPGAGGTGAKAAAAKVAKEGTRFAMGPIMQNIAGGVIGTVGLGLAAGIPGYRDKLIQDTIQEPPGSDGYDRGFLGYKNLFMFPDDEAER